MKDITNFFNRLPLRREVVQINYTGATGLLKFDPADEWIGQVYVQSIRPFIYRTGTTPFSVSPVGRDAVSGIGIAVPQQPGASFLYIEGNNEIIKNNYPLVGNQYQFDIRNHKPELPYRINMYQSGIRVVDPTNTTTDGCYVLEIAFYPINMTRQIERMLCDNEMTLADPLTGSMRSPYFRSETIPLRVTNQIQTFPKNTYWNNLYISGFDFYATQGAATVNLEPGGRAVPVIPNSARLRLSAYPGTEKYFNNYPLTANDFFARYPLNDFIPFKMNFSNSEIEILDTAGLPAPPANICALMGFEYYPERFTEYLNKKYPTLFS